MTRVVFLGSKPIGHYCLQHIINTADKYGVQIVGALTTQNTSFGTKHSVQDLAKQHNIPVIESLSLLPEAEILISVQYHQILKNEHIQKATKSAVNLHMAPLPEYRGCNQFSFAIIDNKQEFGTTLHFIDEKIDHGDILFENRFPIPPQIWVNELYELTLEASKQLFEKNWQNIVQHNYKPQAQINLETSRGTQLHYRNEINEIKIINPSWTTEIQDKYIRATYMPGFEPPYTLVNNIKRPITVVNKSWTL
jgi:methionyl-tRNA formyltransferase